MSKLKHIFIVFLISVFMIINIFSICYATSVAVTNENLKTAFEKFVSSDNNDKHYKISMENKVITITSDDGNYTLNYDLTNQPTFSYEVTVKQGMSYTEFQETTGNLSVPMLGYLAVANIQGVEYEDSVAYFAMNLLQSAFSGLSSANANSSYMIVSDGVTVESTGNQKVIKESEFGNYVMEYVNSIYGEKASYKDSEGFNTFEWTTERKDITNTSCKLVSTITVNLDSDFSQMKGFAKSMADSFNGNNSNNNDNNNGNDNNNDNPIKPSSNNGSSNDSIKKDNSSNNSLNKANNDNTVSKTIIPKTGTCETILLISVIFICVILAVTFRIKIIKYKDIK